MKVNITKAAKMVGHTRATMYAHIQKRGITTSEDENGKPLIDVSELIRVYGDRVKPLEEQNVSNTNYTPKIKQTIHGYTPQKDQIKHPYPSQRAQVLKQEALGGHHSENEILKERIRHLEEINTMEKKERSREREQMEGEIAALRLNLEKAQNHHNQLTALLTDQRSEEERRSDVVHKQDEQVKEMLDAIQNLMQERDEQSQKMTTLERRIVKMKESGDKVLRKYKQTAARNRKLKEALEKPFWKKLVG